MARPIKKVDPKQISTLASINCTVEEIAAVVGLSKRTLERRYAALIEAGRAGGKASLKRRMWQCAMGFTENKAATYKVTRKFTNDKGQEVTEVEERPATDRAFTYEPNTGMQLWLSKQMLGYSEKVDMTNSNTGTQKVEHKWVVMGSDGKERQRTPEDIQKARDEWVD